MSRKLKVARYCSELLVFFEDPFWVGVFTQRHDGELAVCKVTFGAEPKDQEVFEFVLANYTRLIFSPAVLADKEIKTGINPKRMQRQVKKQQQNLGIGTKSQQALKLMHEAQKQNRKEKSRETREAEQQRQFILKQQKKKEKHRGH
jgi:hypothetical protein